MGCEVYANGNEIACKAGDNKVIAEFPDVCLSPPSPPAGPVPVPYPNTSFSKDMQNGSKTVKIKSKEVMLKDKAFYKTSPLGNEAATRTFGANAITHVITGKTYFIAWSMDVKFEGQNVDRHFDLTTSNHASQPGGTGPMGPSSATMTGPAPSSAYTRKKAELLQLEYSYESRRTRGRSSVKKGTAAAALYREIRTLKPTKGKWHYKKVRDLMRAYSKREYDYKKEEENSDLTKAEADELRHKAERGFFRNSQALDAADKVLTPPWPK